MASAPAAAAIASPVALASSGVVSVPAMLCAMARRNSPADSGEVNSAATAVPPADSPNTVTLSGSPPKFAMLSCTQRSAATWSSSARLAGASASHPKPSKPTR